MREKDFSYIIMYFTDLNGTLRGRTIPGSFYKKACEEGIGFDGSSIPGFGSIEESDFVMRADQNSLRKIPKYLYGRKVGLVACDIYKLADKFKQFEGDPRFICKKGWKKMEKEGYQPYVAAELEFYLFKMENGKIEPVEEVNDRQRYFDIIPGRDVTEKYRMDLSDALIEAGIEVERHGKEVGGANEAQNEITFKYADPLKTSDNIMVYKFLAKGIAKEKYGWEASFMPKPLEGKAGNGMHVHISLFSGDKNMFFDPNGYAKISQTCRYFIGGLLEHARALSAIVAPTVNSYKRLVPGYEAPVYIAWGKGNRSTLIRIPQYFEKEEEKRKRIEFRVPDASCNPYLAYACILEAGLDGIKKKIEPSEPMDKNLYKLSETERRKLGIKTLPSSLKEALEEWGSDDICIRALGKEVAEKFVELKLNEWKEYERHKPTNKPGITEWEIKRYLTL